MKKCSIPFLTLWMVFLMVCQTHAQGGTPSVGKGIHPRCSLGYIGDDCDQCDTSIAKSVSGKDRTTECVVCMGHGTVTQTGGNSTDNRNNENNNKDNSGKSRPNRGGKSRPNRGGNSNNDDDRDGNTRPNRGGNRNNNGDTNDGNRYNENNVVQCVCDEYWTGLVCEESTIVSTPAPTLTLDNTWYPTEELDHGKEVPPFSSDMDVQIISSMLTLSEEPKVSYTIDHAWLFTGLPNATELYVVASMNLDGNENRYSVTPTLYVTADDGVGTPIDAPDPVVYRLSTVEFYYKVSSESGSLEVHASYIDYQVNATLSVKAGGVRVTTVPPPRMILLPSPPAPTPSPTK
jgi:hypothetical protein